MANARKPARKIAGSEMVGSDDPRAPLDSAAFLAAARSVLATLKADLLARAEEQPAVGRALAERHETERAARRTADSFPEWRDRTATQVAAAWLLSCVFVRTMEDRGLLATARLAGPGAMDSQTLFFELAPSLTERDYLLTVFRELATFPAARSLFDPASSLVFRLAPSAGAARELLDLFRHPRPEAPAFRFGQADTRFLGDLYQDLDEDVRKRYALLQTPGFVVSFILDRTLEPALERFGLADTTLIDPTCGSGHFLLDAFARLFEHRLATEPGLGPREAARKALDAVFGVDINPYAVAITRFRLTLAYLEKAGFSHLIDAPEIPFHVVVGDSLLHNPHARPTPADDQGEQSSPAWGGDLFALEDEAAVRDVLHRQYASVVGNPPYITEKDEVLRERYRAAYPRSAAGKYSLAAPFCERLFQLGRARGLVGQITANSFMKREFGKKLIENFLPTVNLSLVVNTSGAYIPGHGTPTVILLGSAEPPQGTEVLTVLSKRGEPTTPADPAKGLVWTGILGHIEDVGFENDYISVARLKRAGLEKHPWSLGGGGALELKELLEERAEKHLGEVVTSIGFMAITGEDEAYVAPPDVYQRFNLPHRDFGIGEAIRDWAFTLDEAVLFPYNGDWKPAASEGLLRWLWPYRTCLRQRLMFGKTHEQMGFNWFEYRHVGREKIATPLSIAFAFVATHNHFVLDRGGKVFKQTAPIIKLPASATDDDHFALLAYLNSSTACFWMKQVCMDKGNGGIGGGIGDELWERRYEFDGTKLSRVPLPRGWQVLALLGAHMSKQGAALARYTAAGNSVAVSETLNSLVACQEQLDWQVYELFGLSTDQNAARTLALLSVGGRPFEHLLIARAAAGQQTAWFERNNYPAPTRPSENVAALIREIQSSAELTVIESPEFKRRWRVPDALRASAAAAHERDLDVLEQALSSPVVLRRRQLSAGDRRADLDGLLDSNAIPFVAAGYFSEVGLGKRAAWQRTWELQRAEDRGETLTIGVPPKYAQSDFTSATAWRLRGKLDVPKERFISYPGCESDEDGEPVYGWAGWDHLQRAQALAALYMKRKTDEAWPTERLVPMLAGLLELIPWIVQWHNEPNREFNDLRMGDYFAAFLAEELQTHCLTEADLLAWRPTRKTTRRRTGKPAKAPTNIHISEEIRRTQASWLHDRPGIPVSFDERGYTTSVDQNLFAPLGAPARQELTRGNGGELGSEARPGKLAAPWSSAALAINFFEYWRGLDATPLAKALALDEPIESLTLEAQFATGFARTPTWAQANLDALLDMASSSLAIESKFGEPYYATKQEPFAPTYLQAGEDPRWNGLDHLRSLAHAIADGTIRFAHLDTAQLIKHAIALQRHELRQSPRRRFELLLLWYCPPGDHVATRVMRDEVARLGVAMTADGVRFRAETYQDVFGRLRSATRGHHKYLDYLGSRYFSTVEKR